MKRVRLATALLLAGCGAAVPEDPTAPTRLRVVIQPYLVFAPVWVAPSAC